MTTSPTGQKVRTVKYVLYALTKYKKMLSKMRNAYLSSPEPNALVVPYTFVCAAVLEATLNRALEEYADLAWGRGSDLGKALQSMTLRDKLDSLVPLLTNHRFQWDKRHPIYERLSRLIRLRNQLVHPKDSTHDIPHVETGHFYPLPPLLPADPEAYLSLVEDLAMGADKPFGPLEYHEALEKLEKWFLNRLPGINAKSQLVIPNDANRLATHTEKHG